MDARPQGGAAFRAAVPALLPGWRTRSVVPRAHDRRRHSTPAGAGPRRHLHHGVVGRQARRAAAAYDLPRRLFHRPLRGDEPSVRRLSQRRRGSPRHGRSSLCRRGGPGRQHPPDPFRQLSRFPGQPGQLPRGRGQLAGRRRLLRLGGSAVAVRSDVGKGGTGHRRTHLPLGGGNLP